MKSKAAGKIEKNFVADDIDSVVYHETGDDQDHQEDSGFREKLVNSCTPEKPIKSRNEGFATTKVTMEKTDNPLTSPYTGVDDQIIHMIDKPNQRQSFLPNEYQYGYAGNNEHVPTTIFNMDGDSQEVPFDITSPYVQNKSGFQFSQLSIDVKMPAESGPNRGRQGEQ